MGRRNRERIARIEAGLEQPIASSTLRESPNRILVCKYCNTPIMEYKAREHIRKCWNYPIGDKEPIPPEPVILVKEGAL